MEIPNAGKAQFPTVKGPSDSTNRHPGINTMTASGNNPGFGAIQCVFNSTHPANNVRSGPIFGQTQGSSSRSDGRSSFSAISTPFILQGRSIASAPVSSMHSRESAPTVELDFGDDTGIVLPNLRSDPHAPMPSIRVTNRVHSTSKGGLTIPKPQEVKLTESGKIKKSSYISKLPITVNETGIVGTYSNDLDIKALHPTIVAFLEKYFDNQLIRLIQEYTAVNLKLDGPQHVNRRVTLAAEYHRLRDQIRAAQVGPKMIQFNAKVLGVLAKYDELGPLTEHLDIDEEQEYGPSTHHQKRKNKIMEDSSRHSYRHDIIGEYLGIVRTFCSDISITRDHGKHCRGDCGNCGANVHQTAINEGEPTMCPECGMEVLLLVSGPRTAENGSSSRSDQYGNWNTTVYPYYLAIQGRNNSQLIEDDYQRIKEELYRKGFDPDIISKLPLDSNGRRGHVTISDISKAMIEIGYSKQLNDVYIVARTLFNWILPDLAEYDTRFEELYRLSQDIISLIKQSTDTTGTSSMNAAYRIWWLLSVLGIQLDKSFLGVVTTPKILERYLQIRLRVDKALNWNDPGIQYSAEQSGVGTSTLVTVD